MEELEKKIAELEEKLGKARTMYKEQKAELDNANAKIAELENIPYKDVSSMEDRIKELEDEIAINGNASEEIKTLNERLEKAKNIFAEQKQKIAEKNGEIENLKKTLDAMNESYKDVCDRLSKISDLAKL